MRKGCAFFFQRATVGGKTYVKPATGGILPCTLILEQPEKTHGVQRSESVREGFSLPEKEKSFLLTGGVYNILPSIGTQIHTLSI